MAISKRESVLWSVYDSSSNRTSYLMGTMHLKDHNAYTFAALAEKYVDMADSYAGEMHLDDAAQADLHQYFKLPDGQQLSDLYSERQYARMCTVFYKCTGVKLQTISDLKPMAISNILAEAYAYQDYGLALDHHLWNHASKANKMLFGLESVQDQIDILERIPMKNQITSLKQTLRNVTKYGNTIEQLGKLYAKGQVHKLYRKSKKSLGALKSIMLYDRNANMVSKFIEISSEHSLFAAVGAAHLSGKYGMLHLLHAQGYVIAPVYE